MPVAVLLHGFTHTGASWDGVATALGERYRAAGPRHPRPRLGVGAPARVAGRRAGRPARGWSRARSPWSATRWGAGSPCMSPWPHRSACARLVLIGASPGLGRRGTSDAPAGRPTSGWPARSSAATIEAFAARWAQTPVLAGLPEAVARRAHADRLRNTPDGLAAALRGLGTGALASLWGRLGELDHARDPGRRRARHQVPRHRRPTCRRACRTPSSWSSPARGMPFTSRRRPRWPRCSDDGRPATALLKTHSPRTIN